MEHHRPVACTTCRDNTSTIPCLDLMPPFANNRRMFARAANMEPILIHGCVSELPIQTWSNPTPATSRTVAAGSLGELITPPALCAIRRCLSRSPVGQDTRPATLSLNAPYNRTRADHRGTGTDLVRFRPRTVLKSETPRARQTPRTRVLGPQNNGPRVEGRGQIRFRNREVPGWDAPVRDSSDQASWALATSTRAANPASSWTAMSARTLRSISTSASFRPWMNWP